MNINKIQIELTSKQISFLKREKGLESIKKMAALYTGPVTQSNYKIILDILKKDNCTFPFDIIREDLMSIYLVEHSNGKLQYAQRISANQDNLQIGFFQKMHNDYHFDPELYKVGFSFFTLYENGFAFQSGQEVTNGVYKAIAKQAV